MQHVVVTGEDENPIYNENGDVLIHDVLNGDYFFVEASEDVLSLLPHLKGSLANDSNDGTADCSSGAGLNHIDPSIDQEMDVDATLNYTSSSKAKAYWDYSLTIVLINKYKAHYPLFADDIHTNAAVWDMIAEEFRREECAFTSTQCENRWKYIRAKYIKKKDNDSNGNTGGAYFDFEYFNEIDEILGKKPNVVPKHLASSSCPSSRQKQTSPSCSSSSSSFVSRSQTTLTKRQKQSSPDLNEVPDLTASMFFSDYGQSIAEEEEELSGVPPTPPSKSDKSEKDLSESAKRQNRYHNEMIEMQKESLNVFKEVMFKMMEKFGKK